MLPVLGAVLMLLPALWAPGDSAGPDTGRGGIYLFVVWGALILLALGLARGLAPALEEEEKAEGEGLMPAAEARAPTDAEAFVTAAAAFETATGAATGAALARARSAAALPEAAREAPDPKPPTRGR